MPMSLILFSHRPNIKDAEYVYVVFLVLVLPPLPPDLVVVV